MPNRLHWVLKVDALKTRLTPDTIEETKRTLDIENAEMIKVPTLKDGLEFMALTLAGGALTGLNYGFIGVPIFMIGLFRVDTSRPADY